MPSLPPLAPSASDKLHAAQGAAVQQNYKLDILLYERHKIKAFLCLREPLHRGPRSVVMSLPLSFGEKLYAQPKKLFAQPGFAFRPIIWSRRVRASFNNFWRACARYLKCYSVRSVVIQTCSLKSYIRLHHNRLKAECDKTSTVRWPSSSGF